jgi:hypothetical protein
VIDAPPVPSVRVDERRFLVINGVRVARLCLERKSLVFRDSKHGHLRYVEISLAAIQRVLDNKMT